MNIIMFILYTIDKYIFKLDIIYFIRKRLPCSHTMGRRFFIPVLISVVTAVSSTGCEKNTPEYLQYSGQSMGTSYHVKIVQTKSAANENTLEEGIIDTLARVDHRMSTYRKDSEVSRLNQAAVGEWVAFSADTLEVLNLAQDMSRLTDGSFDATVGTLVNLWGFGSSGFTGAIPSEKKIQQALSQVGYQHIKMSPDGKQVKKVADIKLDFSAIAKGFAVDQIAEYLNLSGVSDYLVEVGGEIRASGVKIDGSHWKIAIESPVSIVRSVQRVIALSDMALATSGDYRNYFEHNGQRYSHTIDPRTGKPVNHRLVSITVIDELSARADALATALTVMGENKGMEFVQAQGIAAFFIVKQEDRFVERYSSEFKEYLN